MHIITNFCIFCSSSGSVECGKALVGAGADVNAKGFNGNTPLILATNGGHVDMVRMLLNNPDIKLHEQVLVLHAQQVHVHVHVAIQCTIIVLYYLIVKICS